MTISGASIRDESILELPGGASGLFLHVWWLCGFVSQASCCTNQTEAQRAICPHSGQLNGGNGSPKADTGGGGQAGTQTTKDGGRTGSQETKLPDKEWTAVVSRAFFSSGSQGRQHSLQSQSFEIGT